MPTRYDLAALGTLYFMAKGKPPLHPINPDAAHAFAQRVYGYIVAMPTDPQAKTNLVNYVSQICRYYGTNLTDAVIWFSKVNGSAKLFVDYCKQNFDIESNGEIITRKLKEAFGYAGSLAAETILAFLRPLLPVVLIGGGIYFGFRYLDNKTKK